MATTKLIEDEYKGSKFLKIMPVDDMGELGTKSIHQFGLKKAEAMLDHVDDIKAWVELQPNRRNKFKREEDATPSS